MLNDYSHDFSGPAKCRAIALSQIGKGAGVIFNVAGVCGLGALDAARAGRVWGIGVDIDQSFLGPHILTSVVKRYDVAMYAELRALKEGRFRTGGTTSLGLKQMGVGLGRISPKVPTRFLRALDGVRAQIAAGKIRVPSRLSSG
jgi:basic membrane protein A